MLHGLCGLAAAAAVLQLACWVLPQLFVGCFLSEQQVGLYTCCKAVLMSPKLLGHVLNAAPC